MGIEPTLNVLYFDLVGQFACVDFLYVEIYNFLYVEIYSFLDIEA